MENEIKPVFLDLESSERLKTDFEFEKYGIGVEDIKAEIEQLSKQGNEANESKGLFTVKTASRWIAQAKTRPIPKMLFSELWFEGELCILFADTNLGKSIKAVQIGNSISKGEPIDRKSTRLNSSHVD